MKIKGFIKKGILSAVMLCFCMMCMGNATAVTAKESDNGYPEIIPENLTCHYGYNQLGTMENGEILQKCYSYINEHAWDFYSSDKEVITEDWGDGNYLYVAVREDMCESFTEEEIDIIINNWDVIEDCFENDNPIYYYMRNAFGVMMNVNNGVLTIYVADYEDGETGEVIEEFTDMETRKQYRKMIEAKLHEYYDLTKDMTSDYEKEEAIYEKVMAEVYYYSEDLWALSSHTIIGAFSGEKTVCDGYAQAFQLACNYCGVDCIYVSGKALGAHAWNAVKLGDGWYSVDATWDDGDPSDDSGYYRSSQHGISDYDGRSYFNMPFSLFYDSHQPYGEEHTSIVWPEFSDDDTYWGVDEAAIINEKPASAEIFYGGDITYEQMLAACEYICEQIEAGKRRIDIYAWDSYIVDETCEQGSFIDMISNAVKNYNSPSGEKFELAYGMGFCSISICGKFYFNTPELNKNHLQNMTILVTQRVDYNDDIVYYKYNIDGSGSGIMLDEYLVEDERTYIPDTINNEEVRAVNIAARGRQVVIPDGTVIIGISGELVGVDARVLDQIVIPDTVRDIYHALTDDIFIPESVKFIDGSCTSAWDKVFGYAGTRAESFAGECGMEFYDVTGKKLIESIAINNFALPEVGDNIADVLGSNIVETDEYVLTESICVSDDTVCTAGKAYEIELHICAKDGYAITPNTLADINGEIAYIENIDTANVIVKYTYLIELEINEANFPDEVFREYISVNFDTEGGTADGVLSLNEIQNVNSINLNNTDVSDLKGIEYFANLVSLSCYGTDIMELDVSRNLKLESLDCGKTYIDKLDVSNNPALRELKCLYLYIAELDISNNTKLGFIDCSYSKLTSLDVSNNTNLGQIHCLGTKLTSLDVSMIEYLAVLNCSNTKLTSIDVSNNLYLDHLYCYNTGITSLDISANTKLTRLECYNTEITSLDVSANTKLVYLSCSNTGITSLDLSNNTELIYFIADANSFDIGEVSEYNINSLTGFDINKASDWTGVESITDGYIVPAAEDILITYKYDCGNGFSATFKLVGKYIKEDTQKVELSVNQESHTFINANSMTQLIATVNPADADVKIVWSSSDPTVATVDKDGVIWPLNDGTAIITAATEDGKASATCTITVDISQYDFVDYSDVFDFEYYIEKYPEVVEECGISSCKAICYFVTKGMLLGHQASEEFNLLAYKSNYPDLGVAFGSDNVKYYEHYINNGKAEGRNATVILVESETKYYGVEYADVYNYDYYINNNPDLKAAFGDNKAAALIHFANMGMKEGRQACENFGAKIYKFNYPGLQESFGEDMVLYYHHYMDYGKAEGRNGATRDFSAYCEYEGVNYTPVYNYEDYIERNPDVFDAYGLDANAVLKHFVTIGMAEGRQGSDDFNYNIYRSNYPDLEVAFGEDRAEYYHHYINSGYNEGRNAATSDYTSDTVYAGVDYADVYSYDYYVTANPDVAAAVGDNKIAVLAHFVRNGMAEGRQASAEFNVRVYMEKNPDLVEEFGADLKAYYIHYIEEGKEAGRVAN